MIFVSIDHVGNGYYFSLACTQTCSTHSWTPLKYSICRWVLGEVTAPILHSRLLPPSQGRCVRKRGKRLLRAPEFTIFVSLTCWMTPPIFFFKKHSSTSQHCSVLCAGKIILKICVFCNPFLFLGEDGVGIKFVFFFFNYYFAREGRKIAFCCKKVVFFQSAIHFTFSTVY